MFQNVLKLVSDLELPADNALASPHKKDLHRYQRGAR